MVVTVANEQLVGEIPVQALIVMNGPTAEIVEPHRQSN